MASTKGSENAGVPYLLTPGPLTTAEATRRAMLRDWGSRDADFIALTARLRRRLAALVAAEAEHVCIPIPGSGTFAVEATLGTLLPRGRTLLILSNGAYGRRMAKICERLGRAYTLLESPEDETPNLREALAALEADAAIGHVAVVHCETTSGILNPLAELAASVAERGCGLIVDAMSSFAAVPIDARSLRFDALIASSNKGLEGVPGIGFAIVRRALIERSAGNAPSLALDLHDQWRGFEANGQWRFTPPTHVAAALDAALDALEAEGGVARRHARYRANARILIEGLRALGLRTLLRDDLQGPVIVTVLEPADPRFDFGRFYAGLHRRGYAIYPGKLTERPSFRIGCIGALGPEQMHGAVAALAAVMAEMGLPSGAAAGV